MLRDKRQTLRFCCCGSVLNGLASVEVVCMCVLVKLQSVEVKLEAPAPANISVEQE